MYELDNNQLTMVIEALRTFLIILNKLKLSDPKSRKLATANLNKVVNTLSLMKEGDSIIITKPNEQNITKE